jgi:LmbE family N-acetylglucosaminyl deacetylase
MGAFSTDDEGFDPDGPADDGNPMGTTEDEINLRVDVMAYAAKKRAAMACHASQLGDSGFFLKMGEEQFAMAFGTEWFIDPVSNEPLRDGWIFE